MDYTILSPSHPTFSRIIAAAMTHNSTQPAYTGVYLAFSTQDISEGDFFGYTYELTAEVRLDVVDEHDMNKRTYHVLSTTAAAVSQFELDREKTTKAIHSIIHTACADAARIKPPVHLRVLHKMHQVHELHEKLFLTHLAVDDRVTRDHHLADHPALQERALEWIDNMSRIFSHCAACKPSTDTEHVTHSIQDVRIDLSDIVGAAYYGGQRTTITRRGKEVAQIVPLPRQIKATREEEEHDNDEYAAD